MNKTEKTSRTDLIRYYSEGFEAKTLKGNALWLLSKHGDEYSISCRILKTKGYHDWYGIREIESTGFSELTCPEKYINLSKPIDQAWRDKVLSRYQTGKENKAKIREMFKEAQKEEKVLKVEIEPPSGYQAFINSLTVEAVRPIVVGRNEKNGLLYKVPLKYIKNISFSERKDK
mgnify:CR=1